MLVHMTHPTPRDEISATRRWAIGIILTILIQTAGGVWYIASVVAQVQSNTYRIQRIEHDMERSVAIIVNRSQLEDILGVRDQRLHNLEQGMGRIERTLERLPR
jgi:hypothetical protein